MPIFANLLESKEKNQCNQRNQGNPVLDKIRSLRFLLHRLLHIKHMQLRFTSGYYPVYYIA